MMLLSLLLGGCSVMGSLHLGDVTLALGNGFASHRQPCRHRRPLSQDRPQRRGGWCLPARAGRSPPAARGARCACRSRASPIDAAQPRRPSPDSAKPQPEPPGRGSHERLRLSRRRAVRRGGAARRRSRPRSARPPTSTPRRRMRARVRRFFEAFAGQRVLLCYALKANSNLAVVRTLADEGAGADIVSGGELQRALAAGVPPERIVFSGVGKSRDEMALALEAGIAQFNVEFGARADRARRGRGGAPAAARRSRSGSTRTSPPTATTRSAPGAARTSSASPTTRRSRSTPSPSRLAGIEIVGLHLHIGSQILSLAPFEAAYRRGDRAGRAAA